MLATWAASRGDSGPQAAAGQLGRRGTALWDRLGCGVDKRKWAIVENVSSVISCVSGGTTFSKEGKKNRRMGSRNVQSKPFSLDLSRWLPRTRISSDEQSVVLKYSFPQKPTNKIELFGDIWLHQTARKLKEVLWWHTKHVESSGQWRKGQFEFL